MKPVRVLLTTSAPSTHLFSLVPMAWAFRAAGHETAVAVPPHCATGVRQAGLTAVVVGSAPAGGGGAAKVVRGPLGPWPEDWPVRPEALSEEQHQVLAKLAAMRMSTARDMLPGLLEFARAWRPGLVVHDTGTLAGPAAAAGLGVPSVGQLWGGAAVIRLDRERLNGPALPGYRELFARAGSPEVRDPVCLLDPCPPSLALGSGAHRLPVRPGLYDGPGDMPDPPAGLPAAPSGRPRVCLAWEPAGPGAPWALPEFLAVAAGEMAARGHEVLVPVPEGGAPSSHGLPSGVRAVTGVPLTRLLPSCGAVVHQGGGGTAMAAVAAGTPQLVLSPRPEQLVNGSRLAAFGVAEHRSLGAVGPDTGAAARYVTGALSRLWAGDAGARAAALREEALTQPSPAEVVPQLLESVLATTHV